MLLTANKVATSPTVQCVGPPRRTGHKCPISAIIKNQALVEIKDDPDTIKTKSIIIMSMKLNIPSPKYKMQTCNCFVIDNTKVT